MQIHRNAELFINIFKFCLEFTYEYAKSNLLPVLEVVSGTLLPDLVNPGGHQTQLPKHEYPQYSLEFIGRQEKARHSPAFTTEMLSP